MSTVTDLESYQQYAEQQQAANNAWSAEQAQKQMDFQERMSSTAHQREVADLKAAGLNPVLSANSGAAVPNGASGDTDTSASGNVGAILQQVLQAQSAREVAGMYNAATMAAAQMAAQASMYGADMAYKNSQDHPPTQEAVFARWLLGQGDAGGLGAGLLGLLRGSGSSKVSAGLGLGLGALLGGNSKALSALGGLGALSILRHMSQKARDNAPNVVVGPETSTRELVAAGLYGNANAAKEAGRRVAEKMSPLDPNIEIWKTQVLPQLKKLGYDTGNKYLMSIMAAQWRHDYDGFMKKYIYSNRLFTNARRKVSTYRFLGSNFLG